jgi:predicted Fe-S protein YdhL (DUF1289 family)
MTQMNRGNFIEDEARYEAAIERNIRNNARKTRSAKWLATEGGKRANAFLFELDEFEYTFLADGTCFTHPVVKACLGDFFVKMRESVTEWGGLTDGQTKAVLAMIERGEARVAERAKAREEARQADADKSGWIGEVGERRVFDLTIRMVIAMEGQYGYSYLHVMNDVDGNVVVYKGTNCLGEKGDAVSVKATVKEHDIRDGVRQTKISRPKEV